MIDGTMNVIHLCSKLHLYRSTPQYIKAVFLNCGLDCPSCPVYAILPGQSGWQKKKFSLNPKVDSLPFAATVAAAAPTQRYQVDPVHQSSGLRL